MSGVVQVVRDLLAQMADESGMMALAPRVQDCCSVGMAHMTEAAVFGTAMVLVQKVQDCCSLDSDCMVEVEA